MGERSVIVKTAPLIAYVDIYFEEAVFQVLRRGIQYLLYYLLVKL